MATHESMWLSLTQKVRSLASGGCTAVSEQEYLLAESKGEALAEAAKLGFADREITPCILVISEAGDRALLFMAHQQLPVGRDPDVYYSARMSQIVAAATQDPDLKIARKAWRISPPKRGPA